ncbi:MAG: tetratricopeptide repeat protein [Bacteroidota bacterium]
MNLKSIKLYFLFSILFCQFLNGEENRLNILVDKLFSNHDTSKVNELVKMCYSYRNINVRKAIVYGHQALKLARKINYKKGISSACGSLGFAYGDQGNLEKSIFYFLEKIQLEKDSGNAGEMAKAYSGLGDIYFQKGLYSKSLKYYLQAVKIYKNRKAGSSFREMFYKIGFLYHKLEHDSLAIHNYKKAYLHFEQNNEHDKIALILQEIGKIYVDRHEFEMAFDYYKRALELAEELLDERAIAGTKFQIGGLYTARGEFKKALEHFLSALEIHEKIGDNTQIALDYQEIANAYYQRKEYTKALDNAKKSLKISLGDSCYEICFNTSQLIYRINEHYGRFQTAFYYQEMYNSFKDTLYKIQKLRGMRSLMAAYELEKAEFKNKITRVEEKESEKQQKIIIIAGIGSLVLFTLLALTLYYSNLRKRESNLQLQALNLQIQINKRKIETQQYALLNQDNIIEEKNNYIAASISYAKNIQKTFLPNHKDLNKFLKDYFIFYKPKDIVSGDFYWYTFLPENQLILAAVDCAGHSVSGAFMSIIGSDQLDHLVNSDGIHEPEKILSALDFSIKSSLKQDEANYNYSMEMAICKIDLDNKKLFFAGANNHLVYIQDDELKIIKGDLKDIGGYGQEIHFTRHELDISTPTRFYLFSDGYQDQFGGPKGKKLMRKNMYELLLANHKQDMEDQLEIYTKFMDKWMNGHEQVDDMLIIGFSLKPGSSKS